MMSPFNIVAPICSFDDLVQVIDAGATEVYMGIMTEKWQEQYGEADFISRRQSSYSHLTSISQFLPIVEYATIKGVKTTLVLNATYVETQLSTLTNIMDEWHRVGGNAVMVSDISLLLLLVKTYPKLNIHLSTLTGVFNSKSVEFFESLGVSRIVLPREITIDEMRQIVSFSSEIEFEVLTLFQRCQYIDAFCFFYHSICYENVPTDDTSTNRNKDTLRTFSSYDPAYSGHGCHLRLRDNMTSQQVEPLHNNDFERPFCASCILPQFRDMGIRSYKIAGRGYDIGLIVKAIDLMRYALKGDRTSEDVKAAYADIFDTSCESRCYYDK